MLRYELTAAVSSSRLSSFIISKSIVDALHWPSVLASSAVFFVKNQKFTESILWNLFHFIYYVFIDQFVWHTDQCVIPLLINNIDQCWNFWPSIPDPWAWLPALFGWNIYRLYHVLFPFTCLPTNLFCDINFIFFCDNNHFLENRQAFAKLALVWYVCHHLLKNSEVKKKSFSLCHFNIWCLNLHSSESAHVGWSLVIWISRPVVQFYRV